MSKIERLTRLRPPYRVAALAAALLLLASAPGLAQGSQGENFSAGKTPAQLFASDCTGSGCHKSPQGLGRKGGIGIGGLSGFLREHYTNSRESAAALANYLQKLPSGPEPREARRPRDGKPTESASGPAAAPLTPAPARWFESFTGSGDRASRGRDSRESATGGRPSRTAAKPDADTKPDDEPATTARHAPAAAKPDSDAKPEAKPDAKPEAKDEEPAPATRANARGHRGRPAAGATAAATPPPAPPAAAAAEPEPAPPPPAPPAPKQFDIFD